MLGQFESWNATNSKTFPPAWLVSEAEPLPPAFCYNFHNLSTTAD
ncbi:MULTISPECIES: hypothetical protein [Nostocaceae]|nr:MULTISPECIES: hypothetical protein [Nostocaceae]